MNNKTRLYGAYGSNMSLEQMSYRCPKAKVVGVGMLPEHKLTFRGRSRGVANIEPCKGRKVPIILWTITEECERALDLYEGFPSLYTKKTLKVLTNNKLEEVMLYVMTKRYKDLVAQPSEYYFNVIKEGYLDNEIDTTALEIAYSECLQDLKEALING